MKLSIIIPVYNVEKYINRCLDSILAQNLSTTSYEVIIINDGSLDNSKLIGDNYAKKHQNFYVFNQKNKGVGSARNMGFSLAKGEYIYFIDPDDYLAANVFKTILFYTQKNDVDILTFTSVRTGYSDLYRSTTNIEDSFNLNKMNGNDYIGKVGFQNEVWWYIIKREYINNLGVTFVEGRWLEDAIFTATLFLNADSIVYLPIDAHRYVITTGSVMTSKEASHYIKVIYDMAYAAKLYLQIIKTAKFRRDKNKGCIERLESRQQSYVFFMMIRILKSRIKFTEVKKIINNMTRIKAYPLNSFLGKDYNGAIYTILVKLFNNRYIYYSLFFICKPIFKFKNDMTSFKQSLKTNRSIL